MNINQLYAFKEVYETHSFSEAANNLKITQSGVTQCIQCLERELNCTLFIRQTRPIAASKAADIYYPYAKEILLLHEKSLDDIKVIQPESFTLAYRITSEGILDHYILSKSAASSFEIEELSLDDFNSTSNWKENYLYFVRANIIKSKNIHFIPAYSSSIYAAVSSSSPLAKKDKIQLDDLKGYTVLLPTNSSRTVVAQKLSGLFKSIPEINVKEVPPTFDLSLRYVSMHGSIAFCTEEFIRKSEHLRYIELDIDYKFQYGFASLGTMTPEMKKFVHSFIEWNNKEYTRKKIEA